MEKNWDKFINAYKSASDSTRDFIDSEAIPKAAEELVFDRFVKKQDQPLLIQRISYVLLGIATTDELYKAFQADPSYTEESLDKINKTVWELKTALENNTVNSSATDEESPQTEETVYSPSSQDDILGRKMDEAPAAEPSDENGVD